MRIKAIITGVATAHLLASSASAAIELISNGNFETGTFAGWTTADQGSGNFSIDAPSTTTPISGHTTAGSAANGNFYAVSDQTGGGVHSLRQTFVVPASSSVVLTFDMFVNDYDSGPIINPAGLTILAGANQHARVDILGIAAGPFDTGAAVLGNFYLGVDAGTDPHAFTHYSFDITSLVGAGGTFQLRFAEVDNQGFFNQGVDNVSIMAATVPEPSTYVAGALLLLPFGAQVIRRLSTSKQVS